MIANGLTQTPEKKRIMIDNYNKYYDTSHILQTSVSLQSNIINYIFKCKYLPGCSGMWKLNLQAVGSISNRITIKLSPSVKIEIVYRVFGAYIEYRQPL